jgi:thiamine-phosphate pyrophosphorylase
MMRNRLIHQLKLCLVTNIPEHITPYADRVRRAVQGGVTMVQLREKYQDRSVIKEKALFLQALLKPLHIPLIINDYVELAAEIGADGVHIGQQDMPVSLARRILGKRAIIGLSIESFAELQAANRQPELSYVTASAVFPSRTKTDCKTIWGLDNLQKLTAESVHPMTSIGGINPDNAGDVFQAGSCGIAVIGALHQVDDPYEIAQSLIGSADQTRSLWK